MAKRTQVPVPVAVIDCGSSAVRAYVAELHGGGERRILEDLSRPVDLTSAFRGGRLDREAMDSVVAAVQDLRQAADAYGVQRLRAVATSALREAANADVLLERLRIEAGVDVEVIDSGEEARLYFEALRWLLQQEQRQLTGDVLLIDVGSGTTVVGLIRRGKLIHAVHEHFGTERLYHAFEAFHDSLDFSSAVDRLTHGAARMILGRLPRARIRHLVCAGDELRRIARLLAPERHGDALVDLPLADLEGWFAAVQNLTPTERDRACACAGEESGLLLLAGSLARQLCRLTNLDEVAVPRLRLRDGMLSDFAPGSHGPHYMARANLLAAARQLATRYGMDPAYADNTASLAAQIFDQTRELHHLGDRERTLLEFASLVHDIGSFVNVRSRHKHSFYLIRAADISGLSDIEKEIVAHIARYHRRSAPSPHHLEFQALPRHTRVLVGHLAAILRLAYALDVERTQRIRQVRCAIEARRLVLHVDRRQIALERWSLGGKAELFEAAFGLEVAIAPREEV